MGAAEPIFGFDLGAAKACASAVDAMGFPRVLADGAGRKVIPAVVSFHPDGHVLVGEEARARRLVDPANTVTSVTRLIGLAADAREVAATAARRPFPLRGGPDGLAVVPTRAGELLVSDVVSVLLEHLRRLGEAALDTDARMCVLATPAYYDAAQRQATLQAATLAGLQVEAIVDEPAAVAAAYAFGRALPELVAVWDFGGAKFECSILRVGPGGPAIVGSEADPLLGGDELVGRIVDHTIKAFWQVHRVDLRADALAPLRVWEAAERALAELSALPAATIVLPRIASAGGRTLDLQLELDRATVARTLGDLLGRTRPVVDEACRRAGVQPSDVLEVLLVGGPTKLPFVRDLAAAQLGRAPRTDVNPDVGIALGTALWGAHGGAPPTGATTTRKRVTARFGSDAQQVAPSVAVASTPRPTRVGRVVTRKMFTAAMPAVAEVTFGEPQPVRPKLIEVLASRLGLSTVGGYCDEILAKDAPVPTEKTRVFSTGKDAQSVVRIDVCQGDSRRFAENRPLGTLILDNLPPRPRGEVRIAVTFSVDADGLLTASARDESTGRQHSVRIQLE